MIVIHTNTIYEGGSTNKQERIGEFGLLWETTDFFLHPKNLPQVAVVMEKGARLLDNWARGRL